MLGLGQDLLAVASPERDTVGIFRERQRLPQRVRDIVPTPTLAGVGMEFRLAMVHPWRDHFEQCGVSGRDMDLLSPSFTRSPGSE